ncbi:MAG: hypothetical protein NZ483_03225 [Verrucomicrobiae bacterium]|nr:hypothetical protein [Verrucomicrobiae bacterium]MDW8343237.1 hypothetical protein [Verrucomicrobiae bacterium]
MSLINEALKRTRDMSFQQPGSPPAPYRAPQWTPPRTTQPFSQKWIITVIAVSIAAALLGIVLNNYRPDLPTKPVVTGPIPRPVPPDTTPPTPTGSPTSADPAQAEAELVTSLLSEMQTQQKPTPPNPPASEPVDPPATPTIPAPIHREPPRLLLQGIIRGGAASEALINGLTYRVGDEVDGARIVAIESGLVLLDFHGTEIRLRLR